MRRALLALLAIAPLAACSGSSSTGGVPQDATTDDASDDAADATMPDAADSTTSDASDASDASDSTTSDAADSTTSDATDATDATDASDASDAAAESDAPHACGVLTVSCPTGCCAVPAVELAPVGQAPSVAVDAAGYIYVVYSIPRSTVWGEGVSIFDPTTSKWTSADVGAGGYAQRVIVSATGRVHHFFGGDSKPYVYRFSDDHGVTWTTRTVSNSAAIGGTGDLAVGAGDVPNVAYEDATTSVWSALTYAVWNGSSWTRTVLDGATTQDSHPSIALAFADRPHVFAIAYHPDGTSTNSVRHVFYDGARWIAENVDQGASYATANDYYTAVRSEIFADDSVRIEYTRTQTAKQQLVRADRTPGSTGTWTLTPVPGVDAPFHDALYVDDVASAPAVIADGLSVYRPNASGTFVAPAPTLLGAQPGWAVVGRTLFVAYTSQEPSTSGRMYFTRFDF